jgi:hypothetical protein
MGVWSALVAGAVLASATGCGWLFSERSTPAAPASSGQVMVEVQSHSWSDITVYLLAGGLPQRLGMVSALSEAKFDFSSHRLNTSGGVRLRALPVAGTAFTSEAILVLPGQSIFWTLEDNLETSSFTVY